MKQAVRIGIVAGVLMSIGLGAQGRNFSGNWTIDTEKTMAAGGGMGGGRGGGGGVAVARSSGGGTGGAIATAGAGGGGVRGGGGGAVARSGGVGGAVVAGTVLTVDSKSFTIAQGQTTTTYALDGSVTDVSNPNRKATAKASWQGDKIAIETTSEGPNGPVVTHATWYLEGEWLVRENASTGPDGTAIVRKTYFKKS